MDDREVAQQLIAAYLDAEASEMQHIGSYELPSDTEVEMILELSRALLFPGYAGPQVGRIDRDLLHSAVHVRIDELRSTLHRQAYRAIHHQHRRPHTPDRRGCSECTTRAHAVTSSFIGALPELRREIRVDLEYAFESDPAASGIEEILLTYPGAYAITIYRIAHRLLRERCGIIPRMMTENAHRKTGIDIHPGATIGSAFFIDHGTGVVIGETSLIGSRVRIYQGVTLGALTVPQGTARPEPGERRHPTIEDDVVIYANATILGGSTTIGTGAVIGGNAFITASVPPGAKVSWSGRTQR